MSIKAWGLIHTGPIASRSLCRQPDPGRAAWSFLRNGFFGLLAVLVWLLCFYGQYRPQPLGLDAPQGEFSAARADVYLARLLGPEKPHPVGSPEDEAVHQRLLGELRGLDVKAGTLHTMGCFGEKRWNTVECATVTDIIGEVAPGEGPAIILMAHTDSVAAGPGAGDDESGVATILETIRAWKARGISTRHPILALFTDGEEPGMLGASAFLADPIWRARVGVVINMESRGNQGRSYLFQTSPGDGALVNFMPARWRTARHPRFMRRSINPANDTDLTPFLQKGLTGYNFSFIGNVAHYHTPRDLRANLDPAALQQHGESALGLVSALSGTDFASLKSGDAIYFDVLGYWLPRLPKDWALPLALLAFLGLALAGWLRPSASRPARARLTAFLMPPALIVSAAAMGFLLHAIAALISRQADPSFAHPWALRLALAFGIWTAALLCARLRATVISAWLWIAGLGVLAAWFLPGFSPYFLFPSLIAAVLFLATARAGDRARWIAAFVAALISLITWINLAATSEAIMGLRAHPLFTVSIALGLIALLPLLNENRWRLSALVCLVVALALAVRAGFLPAFSPASPERLNLHYAERDGQAMWLADPVARLPRGMRRAVAFERGIKPVPPLGRFHVGAAGKAQLPAPAADVSRQGGDLAITLHGSASADGMMLIFPPAAQLYLKAVNGQTFDGLPPVLRLDCEAPDCADATFTFQGGAQGGFDLVEMRRGLPMKGAKLMLARPPFAVPSGSGDTTLLIKRIAAP